MHATCHREVLSRAAGSVSIHSSSTWTDQQRGSSEIRAEVQGHKGTKSMRVSPRLWSPEVPGQDSGNIEELSEYRVN